MTVQNPHRHRFSRWVGPREQRLPDQLLATVLLGTAVIQVSVFIDPSTPLLPAQLVPEWSGLVLRVVVGASLLLTAGRERRRWTWSVILLVDCLLLTWSFAVAPLTLVGILVLLLARLPFVCSVLPRPQVWLALAVFVLAPGAVQTYRALMTNPWELGTVWLYWVAALVIGGSTRSITRSLAAAQAQAQGLAAAAQASATQARAFAVQAEASADRARASEARALASEAQARASEAQAHELAARREHDALHDVLTGLPNRALYADRLAVAVARAERSGADVAVLLVDLDRFKLVNDSRGHATGDQLLVAIGARLSAALRSSDTLARLGGDEFAVIVGDVHDPADALSVAHHLHEALRAAFHLEPVAIDLTRQEVHVTASTGIAFAAGRTEDLGVVLREADTAMYRAKSRGRGLVQVFDTSLGHTAQRHLDLENQLRHDLETGAGALSVAYQPIVDPGSARILGVEALARWNCHGYGPVSPEEFIALAEDGDLIHDLGRTILRTALANATSWHVLHPGLEIAVNVSPVQLQHRDFASVVTRLLDAAHVPAQRLCLEVTESVLLDPHGASTDNLRTLHEAGVKLAVDDFGAGYSSLAQLRRFPPDTLKADKSFIDDAPLLRAVADLATALGCVALAQGVETAQQRDVLTGLDYPRAQGYLWFRPQPTAAVTDLLRTRQDPAPPPARSS